MADQTKNAAPDHPPTAQTADEAGLPSGAHGVGNVDKIREILFGTQMRDYERKFTRLEDRIMVEVTRLREESFRRIDALEAYIRKEVDLLGERQRLEKTDRTQSIQELVLELDRAAKAFGVGLSDLDFRLGNHIRELRQQILDQHKDLSQEISSAREETTAAQQQIASELRSEKMDRSALATLLADLALQISGEPPLETAPDE